MLPGRLGNFVECWCTVRSHDETLRHMDWLREAGMKSPRSAAGTDTDKGLYAMVFEARLERGETKAYND